jgi:hypothetical protein
LDSNFFEKFRNASKLIVYVGISEDPGKDCKLLPVDGRGERIRTSDPLVPNQVLYQAEPLPELAVVRMFTS